MKMAMAQFWFCIFAVLAPQSFAQWYITPLSAVERYLYEQLEDALANDGATLEQLKEVFLAQGVNQINFQVNVTVKSLPANNCSSCQPLWPWQPESCDSAFCHIDDDEKERSYGNTSTVQWELCSLLNISWTTGLDAVEIIKVLANTVVPWCGHGPSLMVLFNSYMPWFGEWHNAYNVPEPIKLLLKKLTCQPYTYQLTNAVGVFFTWVSVNFISVFCVVPCYSTHV